MSKKYLAIILSLLFVFWFWSKNGIQVKTRIIKKNSVIKIYFDNLLLGSARETSSENKKLVINFSKQDLDSIYFNTQSKTNKNNVTLSDNNYELNFILTNPFAVRLNFEGKSPYLFYFNPYRHLNSGWEDNLNVLENKISNRVQIGFLNGIKWICWLIFKPFPLLISLFILMYFFGKKITVESKPNIHLKKLIIPLIICSISFFWSRHLMTKYLGNSPHVPDSISYIVLGKIISTGKLVIPFTDLPSYIKTDQIKEYFFHWYELNKTRLFVPYLLGHPFILSIGNVFGIMDLIPPLVGSITLLLIFIISYYLTRSFIFAIISMLLCLASPFFQTQTIDYMSHNSAALFILLSISPLFLNQKNSNLFILSGLSQGMLLNTRPLTFLATSLTFMLYFAYISYKEKKISKLIYFIIGFLFPLLLFIYYNFLTTGSIFKTPYDPTGIVNKTILGNEFKIGYGLLNTFSNIAVFSLFFLKNYYISFFPLLLSLILLPFSGKLARKIAFLQFLSLSIIGVWTFYDGNFFMYGPRFIYESVPVLTILYGLSFYVLYNSLKKTKWSFISYLIIFIYIINIFSFELSWLGKKQAEYSGIVFVPSKISELKGFNESDGRFLEIYNKYKNKDKIFLMKNRNNWWEYSGTWLNSFPLNKSKPLFMSLPDGNKFDIKNAKIIDWNNL